MPEEVSKVKDLNMLNYKSREKNMDQFYIVYFFFLNFLPAILAFLTFLSLCLQVLPPPNVTGALHIGHALTAAIQVKDSLFSFLLYKKHL